MNEFTLIAFLAAYFAKILKKYIIRVEKSYITKFYILFKIIIIIINSNFNSYLYFIFSSFTCLDFNQGFLLKIICFFARRLLLLHPFNLLIKWDLFDCLINLYFNYFISNFNLFKLHLDLITC
jgi:hypothetical protein